MVDGENQPIARAWVQVRGPRAPAYEHLALTDDHGEFEFENVKPGDYHVVVEPEHHAMAYRVMSATESKKERETFVVKRGKFISGRVLDLDGQPAAAATVGGATPIDPGGSPQRPLGSYRTAGTASDGTFRLVPLPDGEFELTANVLPRSFGKVRATAGQTDVEIVLGPDRVR